VNPSGQYQEGYVEVDHRVREIKLRKICVEQREIFAKSRKLKKSGPLDPEGHVVEIHVLWKKRTSEESESGEAKTPEA
jgi:hypothetical protein